MKSKNYISIINKQLLRFRKDETGAVLVMGLYFFVIMLIVVGIAVDMAYHENRRITLQQTLDRAVLAGARLDQETDPRTVVLDYFDKAGLDADEHITALEIEERLNYRAVSARAAIDVKTMFVKNPPPPEKDNGIVELSDWYNYMGNTTWVAAAGGRAEQGFTDVEITLVVDVSGSMSRHNRLTNLKSAAKTFVDAVLINDPANESRISITMVPYSAVVNIGPTLGNIYNLSDEHDFSYCPIFEHHDFHSLAIDHTEELERLAHFEYNFGWYVGGGVTEPWCPTTRYRRNAILPFETDPDVLKTAIDDLSAHGNTAIDLGMKWGTALLDPSAQPVVKQLVDRNLIDARLEGMPHSYNEGNTQKVIVLMTDGENTTEYDLEARFKEIKDNDQHMSPVWAQMEHAGQTLPELMESTGWDMSRLSYRYNDNRTPNDHTDDEFMRYNQWNTSDRELDHPYGYPDFADATDSPDSSGLVRRMSWVELFATWTSSSLHDAIGSEPRQRRYITSGIYQQPQHAIGHIVTGGEADARLSQLCTRAKEQGDVIYTIAFEAPQNGQRALEDCATSDSTYYDVEGTDISAAFESIATDITRLQLTQ